MTRLDLTGKKENSCLYGDILEARAFAYDLLRHAFLEEPSVKFIRLLVKERIIPSFPFAELSPPISEGVQVVEGYLRKPDVLAEKNYQALHWDYTRMFIGPYELPAPPWESVYTDRERLLFSEATLAVREAYRKYNLLPKNPYPEADDHIGLELDFLYKLCGLAKDKLNQGDKQGLREILKDQKAFLDDHLIRWAPDWARDVIKNAQTDFYKGMAQILKAYLPLDSQLLADLLEQPAEASD